MILNIYDDLQQKTSEEVNNIEKHRDNIENLQFLARRTLPNNMLAVNSLAQYCS